MESYTYRESLLPAVFDTTLAYKPLFHSETLCRMRVYRKGDLTAVVFTELNDQNPGNSVTNASEWLATEAARKFGLDTETTIWFEHYPAELMQSKWREKPQVAMDEQIDRIVYTWDGRTAGNPVWSAGWRKDKPDPDPLLIEFGILPAGIVNPYFAEAGF